MGAHPGMTSMYPSVTTWATSYPYSAMERVTSVGVWTRMAENCRAHAHNQAPCLHVSMEWLRRPSVPLRAFCQVFASHGGQGREDKGYQVR